MTPRLHLPGPLTPGARHALEREASHYLCRVLRLAAGDAIEVTDGEGARHAAELVTTDPRACALRIGPALPSGPESLLRITLAQCVSAGEKMDWTIEKAVELGVAAIRPLTSERSVVRLDAERTQRRAAHWQRIVTAACMQCGRDLFPALTPAVPLTDWVPTAAAPLRLALVPGASIRLRELVLPQETPSAIDLLVGPESGLAPAEVALAVRAGFVPVSLGPRVLRTETAGLAAIAALQARFGDL
jgi:16S rRNA (uracil1498-N3)-methyltransferase